MISGCGVMKVEGISVRLIVNNTGPYVKLRNI
jgi:hypothetical protein